ncbi:MAG: NADPH-dependent glutamate synthase [Candidatus Omnitrophica bacterium]|nr:NADPH-dependent glutamate synthase [Candidatus Omnitrophota bacterium]
MQDRPEKKQQVEMREQSPEERVKNFNEVPRGYSEEEAVREASRCLQCKVAPCVAGCPAEVDIPAFIKAIKEKRFAEAIEIIKRTNNLGAVCGRVCPQEDQCEAQCVLARTGEPINIGALERFAADWERENRQKAIEKKAPEHDKPEKVGVIGAGPAGLVCASDLAKMGYDVTVFEALHKPGGVLTYGIPEFRLPKDIVMDEVESIKKLGVDIKCNYIIGKIKTIEELRDEGFKAFFIGTGAGLPNFMGIPGENLNGVYSANEFLTRVNLMKAYKFPEYDTPVNVGKRVAVVGAGNVAMDSARSALRLGAEKVYIVYRRSEKEMPARIDEIHHAQQEGIEFHLLTTPVEIIGDEKGEVKKLVCIKNELGEPDASGRRRPVPVKGSEYEMDMDTVIIAIGNSPNPVLVNTINDLKLGKWGNIDADEETCRTNIEDIFAGGDIVTGAATVIAAMGAGKRAARSIDEYLRSKKK